jgi:endonuclease/exonuclease/phosphatase (EEP) superfamily protein YafD
LFGFVLLGAIGANLGHAILIRDEPRAFWLALMAFLLMVASFAIFFIWTYPANQATSNWTVVPTNLASLRTQWEYSHAANAAMTFLALCVVTASLLVTKR